MTKASRSLKTILENPDILYPDEQFPGIVLEREDFINIDQILEISYQETLKKYIAIRDIANKIAKKKGILKGLVYDETDGLNLTLLLQASNINSEELKELASKISRYDINDYIWTKNGKIVSKDIPKNKNITDVRDYEYPTFNISEEILYHLLNSTNLTSELEYEIAHDYMEELTQYQEAIDSGILYPDFSARDYTGNLIISSEHNKLLFERQKDTIDIPSKFGHINLYLTNSGGSPFTLNYHASDQKYTIEGSYWNKTRILTRGFVHRDLLPKPYRKN